MKKILETVIKYGARPAEPGEFTKRAFLNGRIDLSQAEAVMDVIHSKNDYAMKSSVSQLKGSLSRKIRKLREDILYQIAFIESALDDPEPVSYTHLDVYKRQGIHSYCGYSAEICGYVNKPNLKPLYNKTAIFSTKNEKIWPFW